jgi:hypothetical protein
MNCMSRTLPPKRRGHRRRLYEVRWPTYLATQQVGDVVLEYLRKGRPPIQGTRLFVRMQGPSLTAGVDAWFHGAHVPRLSPTGGRRTSASLPRYNCALCKGRGATSPGHCSSVDGGVPIPARSCRSTSGPRNRRPSRPRVPTASASRPICRKPTGRPSCESSRPCGRTRSIAAGCRWILGVLEDAQLTQLTQLTDLPSAQIAWPVSAVGDPAPVR